MTPWRFQTLQSLFWILGIVIILRLFYWQVVMGEKLQAMAESQHFSQEEIPTKRGKILATDGFPLTTSQKAYLVFANLPKLDLDKTEVASRLAPFLDAKEPEKTKEEIFSRLNRQNLVWVPLARKIDRETKEKVEKLEISGIGFQEEEKRFYPEGSMSAHLLGFVGQDRSGQDKGYFGLEGFYDRLLAGRPGLLFQEKDASGKPILIGESSLEGEILGRDLQTFLNRSLQYLLEEKLKKGIEKYQAKGGLAVMMDPATGAILGMASFPSYYPAEYSQTDKTFFSNPVVSQTFEPGSIFKPLVMAAAINQEVVVAEEKCSRCNGPRQIGEYVIKTWDEKYHPDSTMTEILEHSDNVGMVYVSEKLGKQKLLPYLKNFGLGELTGIDLEGETTAEIRPEEDWTAIDLATAAFGQGVAVTPIQMVRAMAAIANGGVLLEPHVVAKIKSEEKEVEIKPKVQRRVIKETTAKIITEMMVNAVEKGGRWEKPKGYRIAGKTGTAQIPIAGHYDKEKTIVSFIGFAPADQPRFIMLVTLQEPSLTWGSMTVAPLWFEMAKEIFYLLGIPPSS